LDDGWTEMASGQSDWKWIRFAGGARKMVEDLKRRQFVVVMNYG
jgi:hypothetical protein